MRLAILKIDLINSFKLVLLSLLLFGNVSAQTKYKYLLLLKDKSYAKGFLLSGGILLLSGFILFKFFSQY